MMASNQPASRWSVGPIQNHLSLWLTCGLHQLSLADDIHALTSSKKFNYSTPHKGLHLVSKINDTIEKGLKKQWCMYQWILLMNRFNKVIYQLEVQCPIPMHVQHLLFFQMCVFLSSYQCFVIHYKNRHQWNKISRKTTRTSFKLMNGAWLWRLSKLMFITCI